jgi:hypothetical protein
LSANAIKGAPANDEPAAAEVTVPEIDPAAVAQSRAPHAAVVDQLKMRFPNALDYESRGSADLVIDASLMGAKFGDEEVAALKPLAGQIVVADFSSTAISDRSAVAFAAMKHLRTLRLMHTRVTDAAVLAVGGLDQLESLDIYGTAVTPACLKVVGQLPKLQHLYVGETKIPPGIPESKSMKGKLVF